MQPSPKSKENELIADVNALRASSERFLDPEDPQWLRLVKEAHKVRSVENWAGWSVLGSLSALVGDVEGMNRAFKTSLAWKHDPTTVSNWIGNLTNIGNFSAAQELFAKEAKPQSGFFGYLVDVGLGAFAWNKLIEYQEIAKGLDMELGTFDITRAAEISAFLNRIDVSDSDVAKHMDVAGEILRKHRMPVTTKIELHQIPSVLYSLTIAVGVPASQSEVFDMNIELAMAEEERAVKKHPAFDIVFSAL